MNISITGLLILLIIAGICGALLTQTTNSASLESISFQRSADVLVMLVLGGAGHLWGALGGAVIFMIFEHIVAAANPFHWMTLVGVLLIGIVVFAPKGLIDPALRLFARFAEKGRAP